MDFPELLNGQDGSQSSSVPPSSSAPLPSSTFSALPRSTALDESSTLMLPPEHTADPYASSLPTASESDASFPHAPDPHPANGSADDALPFQAYQAASPAFQSVSGSMNGPGGTQDGLGQALVEPTLAALVQPEQEVRADEGLGGASAPTAEHLGLPAPPIQARGASPVSLASFVPDSDDEGAALSASGVKQENEDMDVDVLGGAEDGAAVAALRAQASTSASSLPKPKPKKKSSGPRYFVSGGTSPAPSPGPSSGLANEVFPSSASSASSSSAPVPLPSASTSSTAYIDPAFHHTGPPSSFIHPRLRNLSPSSDPPLPAAFTDYRPPKGGKPQDDSDSDDEETRRRERAKRAAAASRGKRRRRGDDDEEEDSEEKDDRLYCVCRKLYDPERMMIACDKCEEWYHVDCVGIAEDAVELVDLFICPNCQATSLDRTTWKSPCQRPLCRKPSLPLSKYCSDYCGILVASSRLSLLQYATSVAPESFYPSVQAAKRKETGVVDHAAAGSDVRVLLSMEERRAKQAAEWAREDAAFSRTRGALSARLEETEERTKGLEERVRMVELRSAYLKVAVKRWEALCQATAEEMQQAGIDLAAAAAAGEDRRKRGGGKGRKKGPVSATSLPDAQCGLDVRLVFDDKAWSEWVADEGAEGGKAVLEAQERGEDGRVLELALEMLGGVCLETRKRCERHQGWQKVREADFTVEKNVLHRRLTRLTSLSASLAAQLATHDAAVSFRRSVRSRTADPDRLIDVEDHIADLEAAAAAARPQPVFEEGRRSGRLNGREVSPELGGYGGRRGNGRESPELGGGGGGGGEEGEYEIPPEVLPFLSRADIARLRANKGRM
ncbi:hypothetical protein JCM8547_005314 [Rhodosporidiobolus lusitaniae]